jgi:hypothetical protein
VNSQRQLPKPPNILAMAVDAVLNDNSAQMTEAEGVIDDSVSAVAVDPRLLLTKYNIE